MDKKSKIFFAIFFSVAFIIIAMSFFKFFVLKDYYIKSEADCDPETEKCFIYECDPTVDTECSENPDERISYYKLIEKKAYALPLCDSSSSDCPSITCQAGEDCKEFLCDEATKTQDEQCNNPEEYLKNKEEIESSNECAQDNENCVIDENATSDQEGNQENTNNENQTQANSETGN
jgi:hypothetical protein